MNEKKEKKAERDQALLCINEKPMMKKLVHADADVSGDLKLAKSLVRTL